MLIAQNLMFIDYVDPSLVPPIATLPDDDDDRVTVTPISTKILIVAAVISFIMGILLANYSSCTTTLPDSLVLHGKTYPAFSNLSLNSSLPLPKSIAEYQNYLREYYRSRPYPPYYKPVLSTHRPEYPINLVLVRQQKNQDDESFHKRKMDAFKGNITEIQNRATSVKMNEIGSLNGGKMAAHFVLIEGRPGIGKSTLCWQLCQLWSKGEMLYEWDLMVIIQLRDETTRKAKEFEDLLRYSDDDDYTSRAIAKDIVKRKGKGLFLLLDGYDELSKEQLTELSIIQKILNNKLISEATVVVTSRPVAMATLPYEFQLGLNQIENQHMEIYGFNETDVLKYITLACGANQHLLHDFHHYISNNRFVLSVMYNSLHCTIVTELYIQYWLNGKKLLIPNTLTGIYSALVVHLLRHNLPSNLTIERLSDIPDHVNNSLIILAELAANGLKDGRYTFNEAPDCETLGLLVSVRRLYEMRPEEPTSYIFLHLTLQEFLAALYWSRHPNLQPTELNILKAIKVQDPPINFREKERLITLRWPVYLFLAGITRLDSFPLLQKSRYKEVYDSSLVCQLLFEAQSPQLVSKMFAYTSVKNNFFHKSSLNWFVYGYCVANSDQSSTWFLVFFSNERLLRSFSDGMHYSVATADWDEKYKPLIKMYFEPLNNIASVSFEVFDSLYPFTRAITELRLEICPENVPILQNLDYYCPRLTTLELPAVTNSSFLTSKFQLPLSLTRLKLRLPDFDMIFDDIHQYQDLTELYIRTR